MKVQTSHFVLASVKGWAEHTLLVKGEAFTNFTGRFYDVADTWNGYYTYASPFQPLVADASIPNSIIMSGIYLDNTYIVPGQSGLIDIDFEKGQLYFSSGLGSNAQNRLSGNFSVAEFNVKTTNEPEESLLFETKYQLKPKTDQTLSGLGPNDVTFPVIYIKNFGGRSDPFAFGGLDKQISNIRFIVLADSQFAIDGVNSIFKDKARTLIPLLTGINEMPFNNYGGYANGIYNYNVLTTGKTYQSNSLWVDNVDVSSLPGTAYAEIRKLNPFVFVSIVDLTICNYKNPRNG